LNYLALLRGINVGGKNLVPMAELRAAFEEMKYDDVSTYIASGNVLFDGPRTKRADLVRRIESGLTRRFGTELKVVVLTKGELEKVVEEAPRGFGSDTHRCDVIFLRRPLTVKKTFGLLEMKEGVDEAWTGPGVVYFSRLAAKASSSRMGRIVALSEYQNMTIRSWNTAVRLRDLMAEPS
jgi:uncharacterized protein (DUF1697 family)